MNFSTMNKQRKFVLIASVVGIISMFLPWFSISVFGYTQSVNGMHGWGTLAFICFLVTGGIAFLGDQTKNIEKNMWLIVLVAGLVALIIAITRYFDVSDSIMGSSLVGFGLYIAGIAAIGVIVSAYMFRSPTDNLKDSLDSMKKNIESKINTPSNTGSNSGNNSDNTHPPA
ncbi:MAG TPA: hypothetical protein VG847_08625 [Chitinophagaceae bacterium]|nr:hypothetical protein [Chitinophagaceae bacterium]